MLVQRRNELDLLRGMFADCVAGNGRIALISGCLASGKTELLHAISEHAVEHGALLLTATGARAEQAERMGVVWQLFRSAPLPPQLLDRVERLIGAEPAINGNGKANGHTNGHTNGHRNGHTNGYGNGNGHTNGHGHAAAGAVQGICTVLLELAKDSPVVIAVDDLQFVDAPSLEVLRYLRCRMKSAAMLMALTEWERPNLARPLLRAEVIRQPHSRIALGPLCEAGVAELLSQRLESGSEDAAALLAPAYFALGGGNPFLTHALIEDQGRPTTRRDATPAVGTAFRDAVLDCLHRWDPEFLRVAGGMAVLGEHATPELIGELLRVQPHSVGNVLEALTAAGLVCSGRLRHAEIAATVLESLAPHERTRLHARAAELLYLNGVDASDVARHLLAADAVPPSWAVWPLQHAADQSLAEDAGLAVKYLELAVRACADESDRVALRAAAVRAAWRANPSVAARHLTPLQAAVAAGDVSWPDAVPVIRHLLWQGDLDGAVERLRAMHASAGQADARTAAELRLAGEWIYGRLRDRVPEDVCVCLPATERADSAAPVFSWRRTATLNRLWTRGATGDVVSVAEHILQGCIGDVLPEVGATALLALDDAGQHQRAMFWYEALSDEAARQRATTWQAVLDCVRADIAWRRGELVTARAKASSALDLLHPESWGVLIGYPLSVLVLANTAMNDYDTAAGLLDRPVPEAMFDTAFGLRYLHASGHFNLACGRPLAARDDFERCAASMRRWGLEVPATVPWRSDLASAYLEVGMRHEARTLVAEHLTRQRAAVNPRSRAMSLRVLAACSELSDRVGVLREAVQLLERCADRLHLAKTLTDLGEAYRELGDLRNARVVLRRAEQLTKACHAQETPVRKARGGGVALLSEAEQKVAALAASGHSNREIGRKLYITVSTVEQHLTRVYRKLNVSGRTALLAELLRHEMIDPMPVSNESRVLVPR